MIDVAMFPPTLVIHLACKLPLDLALRKHTTERKRPRLKSAQHGDTGVGERSGRCPAGHGEHEEDVEDPEEREGVRGPYASHASLNRRREGAVRFSDGGRGCGQRQGSVVGARGGSAREQTEGVPGEGEERREGAEVQAEAEVAELAEDHAEDPRRGGGGTVSTADRCAESEDGDGEHNGREGDHLLFHFTVLPLRDEPALLPIARFVVVVPLFVRCRGGRRRYSSPSSRGNLLGRQRRWSCLDVSREFVENGAPTPVRRAWGGDAGRCEV